ncbi:MAG TPA: universal stress protein [Candidatus Thermoplasmatota archaeon]|nr:universal stress protein [Candidatus Thermoplasmatota archaeon]
MRVLFPLDGSERGFASMEAALDLLGGTTVEATLLVVMHDFKGAPEEMIKEFEEDTEDEIFPTEGSAVVVLKQATARMRRKGLRMKLQIGKGNIVDQIIAESANHDLLVIHSARRTSKMFKLRSSRTKKIISGSICNVLLMQKY